MNATAYMCFGCKKHFPVKELRYDSKGNNLLCAPCREAAKQQTEGKRPMQMPQKQQVLPPKDIPRRKAQDAAKRPKPRAAPDDGLSGVSSVTTPSMHYRCCACNYTFIRSTKVEAICPYCSKKGTIRSDRTGGHGSGFDF